MGDASLQRGSARAPRGPIGRSSSLPSAQSIGRSARRPPGSLAGPLDGLDGGDQVGLAIDVHVRGRRAGQFEGAAHRADSPNSSAAAKSMSFATAVPDLADWLLPRQ